jgi:methylated-DNA-[protein]-cysteine S-methyltransferase
MNFNEKCYELLKNIPKGKVTTYKEIAKALKTKAYRAVGNAMNKNPNPVEVPCHRVVKTDGSLGGYAYGDAKKISFLKEEGVEVKDGKIVNFEAILHRLS